LVPRDDVQGSTVQARCHNPNAQRYVYITFLST
jgi:hypothetical protein